MNIDFLALAFYLAVLMIFIGVILSNFKKYQRKKGINQQILAFLKLIIISVIVLMGLIGIVLVLYWKAALISWTLMMSLIAVGGTVLTAAPTDFDNMMKYIQIEVRRKGPISTEINWKGEYYTVAAKNTSDMILTDIHGVDHHVPNTKFVDDVPGILIKAGSPFFEVDVPFELDYVKGYDYDGLCDKIEEEFRMNPEYKDYVVVVPVEGKDGNEEAKRLEPYAWKEKSMSYGKHIMILHTIVYVTNWKYDGYNATDVVAGIIHRLVGGIQ